MTNSEPARSGGVAVVGIVAGHGDFAAGLVSAVAQITGCGDRLLPVSNRELGPAAIEDALRTAAASHPVRVLFTDLPGGSCTMAARRLLRERPDLVLVTGTNLVTLLDFVLGADGDPAESDAGTDAAHRVATHAAERGRAALVAHPLVAPARPATPPAPASPDSALGVEVGSAD